MVPTLKQWRGMSGQRILSAIRVVEQLLAVARAVQVKEDDPDEKGYPAPPG